MGDIFSVPFETIQTIFRYKRPNWVQRDQAMELQISLFIKKWYKIWKFIRKYPDLKAFDIFNNNKISVCKPVLLSFIIFSSL